MIARCYIKCRIFYDLDRDDRRNNLCHVFSVVMLNAKIHVQHLHGLNGALANQDIVTKITERKIESESGIKNRQFQVNEIYLSIGHWKNRGFQNNTHHIRTKIALELILKYVRLYK